MLYGLSTFGFGLNFHDQMKLAVCVEPESVRLIALSLPALDMYLCEIGNVDQGPRVVY